MLRALLSRVFGFLLGRIPANNHLQRDSLRDLKQVAGMILSTRTLRVWVGPAGRCLSFAPPLEVRILSDPEGMVFDSLPNQKGETAVFYEVEVLDPKRLPEGAVLCLIDGPSYGPSSVTRPRWWILTLVSLETACEQDSNTSLE
jgi:hypothetical protein